MRDPNPNPAPAAAAGAPFYGSVPRASPPPFHSPAAASWAPAPSGYAKVPTNPPPPTGAVSPPPPTPAAPESPAARVGELVARFKEQGQALIAARRPWAEVFHAPSFSKPANTGEAAARIRRNAAYFRANYTIVVLAVLAAGMIYHPGSLIVLLALCAAWFFLYFSRPAGSGPLVLFGRAFDDGTVLAALAGVTVVALLFTDIGWNVVGSALIGVALVAAHGALRSTDDLFLTEQEASGGGLVVGTAAPVLPTYVRVG